MIREARQREVVACGCESGGRNNIKNTITERSNLNNRLQKAGNFIIGNEKNLKRPTNNLEPKT